MICGHFEVPLIEQRTNKREEIKVQGKTFFKNNHLEILMIMCCLHHALIKSFNSNSE